MSNEPMNYSTYPDELRDCHGALRNVPAADWPVRRSASYSAVERGLAASLVPYVFNEDVGLSREQFLRTVRERIDLDLLTGDGAVPSA